MRTTLLTAKALLFLLLVFAGTQVQGQINIQTTFKPASPGPLDLRDTIATLADTSNAIINDFKFEGQTTWVADLKKEYRFTDGAWREGFTSEMLGISGPNGSYLEKVPSGGIEFKEKKVQVFANWGGLNYYQLSTTGIPEGATIASVSGAGWSTVIPGLLYNYVDSKNCFTTNLFSSGVNFLIQYYPDSICQQAADNDQLNFEGVFTYSTGEVVAFDVPIFNENRTLPIIQGVEMKGDTGTVYLPETKKINVIGADVTVQSDADGEYLNVDIDAVPGPTGPTGPAGPADWDAIPNVPDSIVYTAELAASQVITNPYGGSGTIQGAVDSLEANQGGGGGITKGSAATLIIAASTSIKSGADYTANGTDDHVTIQAAVDSLAALGTKGGSIFLMEGDYNLGGAIYVPHTPPISILGAGPATKIIVADDSTGIVFSAPPTNVGWGDNQKCEVSNLTIYNDTQGAGATGIEARLKHSLFIRDCWFYGRGLKAIYTEAMNNCYITDNQFQRLSSGIEYKYGTASYREDLEDVVIANNEFSYMNLTAIKLHNPTTGDEFIRKIIIEGNTIEEADFLNAGSPAVYVQNGQNVSFTGNVVSQTGAGNSVVFEDGKQNHIADNHILECGINDQGVHEGIVFLNESRTIVNDNFIRTYVDTAIYVDALCNGIRLRNNIIDFANTEIGDYGISTVIEKDMSTLNNIGVGTLSPNSGADIDVVNDVSSSITFRTSDSSEKMEFGINSDGDGFLYNRQNFGLEIGTNNTRRLEIADNGYMTLYNSSTFPLFQLQSGENSNSTYPRFQMFENSSTGFEMQYHSLDNKFRIRSKSPSDAVRFTIQRDDGYIGINDDTPSYLLDVNGTSRIVGDFITTQSGTFGTSLESETIDLLGSVASSNILTMPANKYFAFENSGSTYSRFFGANGSDQILIGGIDSSIDAVLFYKGNSERMRINSAGNVSIGTTANLARLAVEGGIHAGNDRIQAVATPTSATDAANKSYVDAQVTAGTDGNGIYSGSGEIATGTAATGDVIPSGFLGNRFYYAATGTASTYHSGFESLAGAGTGFALDHRVNTSGITVSASLNLKGAEGTATYGDNTLYWSDGTDYYGIKYESGDPFWRVGTTSFIDLPNALPTSDNSVWKTDSDGGNGQHHTLPYTAYSIRNTNYTVDGSFATDTDLTLTVPGGNYSVDATLIFEGNNTASEIVYRLASSGSVNTSDGNGYVSLHTNDVLVTPYNDALGETVVTSTANTMYQVHVKGAIKFFSGGGTVAVQFGLIDDTGSKTVTTLEGGSLTLTPQYGN